VPGLCVIVLRATASFSACQLAAMCDRDMQPEVDLGHFGAPRAMPFDVRNRLTSDTDSVGCGPEDSQRAKLCLRHLIAAMDAPALFTKAVQLLAGSIKLLRRTMSQLVDDLSDDELHRWKQALSGSDSGAWGVVSPLLLSDFAPPEADCNQEDQEVDPEMLCPTYGTEGDEADSVPVCRFLSNRFDTSQVSISDFAPPEADCDEEREDDEYPDEDEAVDDSESSVADAWNWQLARLEALAGSTLVTDSAAMAGHSPLLELSPMGFEAPNAWIVRGVHPANVGDVSFAHRLAVEQVARMKDFAICQLERQLGFERNRDEWLTSLEVWREQCEHVIGQLVCDMPCDLDPPEAFHFADTTVRGFLCEDKRMEDEYASHSSRWWHVEAESVQCFCSDIEEQSTAQRACMSADDRSAYDACLWPSAQTFVSSFNIRRNKAAQSEVNRSQELQKYHYQVWQRLLHIVFQQRHNCETVNQPTSKS